MGFFRVRLLALAPLVLCAMASTSALAPQRSEAIERAATSTYSIDFHVISAGGNTLRGNCYRLSGTIGQPAPGFSSASIYSLIGGYWQAAPSSATDEIFFNGFERC